MRKPSDVDPASSHRRLAVVLVCAFAGCLNPRPEEYPSDTASPDTEAAAPGAANPSRQGADNFEPTSIADPNGAPDSTQPAEPTVPPAPLVPPPSVAPPPADAGVDAGVADAGAPAISE